jgi:TusA-related sulfurtransferase
MSLKFPNDFQSKNALLTAQNQILEAKLEKQQLQARIHELMEENAVLKQTNVEHKGNEVYNIVLKWWEPGNG